MGDITGSKARKEAKKTASAQQNLLDKEKATKEAEAKQLSQEQTDEYRRKQKTGLRSLIGTSESSYLGE